MNSIRIPYCNTAAITDQNLWTRDMLRYDNRTNNRYARSIFPGGNVPGKLFANCNTHVNTTRH
jgi:hypothetical protein